MFGPTCSSQTVGCTTVDNSSPNTTKRRYSGLGLTDAVSFVIVRSLNINHSLGLAQNYNDYYPGVGSNLLALLQILNQSRALQPLESILDFEQTVVFAGHLLPGGGGGGSVTMEAIFDSDTLAGEVIYISGDGHVDLAQANDAATTTAVGIATQDVSAGATGEYIPVGPVSCDTWTLTPGTVYYLDPDVPGGMTAIYPDNSGEFVIILGAAATSKQLNLEIHWMLEQ